MSGDRTTVKTYVPEYQKDEWRSHAEELDMPQSEFVRTMVQAGRTVFEPGEAEPGFEGSDPRGDALEEQVLGVLDDEHRSWDEVVDGVAVGLEDRVEAALQSLQEAGAVAYHPRDGGYVRTDDE